MAKNFTPKPPKAGKNRFENMSKNSNNGSRIELGSLPRYATTFSLGDVDSVEVTSDALDHLRTFMATQHEEMFRNVMLGRPFGSSEPVVDRELAAARGAVEKYLVQNAHRTGWDDVVGNEKARIALLEAIEHPVKHAGIAEFYGIKPSKGMMLYGPPGCGKTMFGKAAASALSRLHGKDVELLVINGPEIQSPYVGVTEEIIRKIFKYARLYHKKHGHQLVIFIDEADAILPSREGTPMWNASNVATFLTEMDGMGENGALVILATNRPDALDEALLRDGRCDRKIRVERPDRSAAETILSKAMHGAPTIAGSLDLSKFVDHLFDPQHTPRAIETTTGSTHRFNIEHIVSGAMIVGLVNRAKGIAMRRDMASGSRTGILQGDLLTAVDEVVVENKGLNHDFALREFLMDTALPAEQARASRSGMALN